MWRTITAGRTLSPNAVLVLVCSGVFLASLDQTSVVTALPEVMLDMDITIDQLHRAAWVVTAYLLGFTVAMPLLARAGDVYGHRRLYQGAIVLFAVGSIWVALAQSLSWLLVARVVQAVGGGALIPSAIALASEGHPAARRGIIYGIVGAAAEMGAVLGPLYGAALIHTLGWRWIFWTNLPFAAVLLLATFPLREAARQPGRLDVLGGLLLAAGLTLLTLALAQQATFEWRAVWPFLAIAASVALLVAFVWVERRAVQPILGRGLFLSRAFLAAFSTQLLVGSALIMALVTIPLMTDTVLGKEPLEGGLRLMRFTGALAVGALVGGYATRWVGCRAPTVVGLGIGALGMLLMSGWDLDIAEPALSVHLVTGGLGFGLVIAPLMMAGVNAGSDDYKGTAAAFITVARMLGMTLGLAALSAWGMSYFQLLTAELSFPLLPSAGETQAAYDARVSTYEVGVINASLDVFTAFFRTGAALSLAAIVPALLLPGPVRRSTIA